MVGFISSRQWTLIHVLIYVHVAFSGSVKWRLRWTTNWWAAQTSCCSCLYSLQVGICWWDRAWGTRWVHRSLPMTRQILSGQILFITTHQNVWQISPMHLYEIFYNVRNRASLRSCNNISLMPFRACSPKANPVPQMFMGEILSSSLISPLVCLEVWSRSSTWYEAMGISVCVVCVWN